MISCGFFMGSCFVLTFYVVFVTVFFSFCCFGCVLFSKIEIFGLGLSFDFLVFYFLFFRLVNSLQKKQII